MRQFQLINYSKGEAIYCAGSIDNWDMIFDAGFARRNYLFLLLIIN
jgi:hypothetical protein